MTDDARREADEAIRRFGRIEAVLNAQASLPPAQREALGAAAFDPDDLATLSAALKCFRLGEPFRQALGLPPRWRTQDRRALVRRMIVELPTRSLEPCRRATEIHMALKRHVPVAHDQNHPLSCLIQANDGRRPSFSFLYKIFSSRAVAEKSAAA
jgi:hypothetical protein